MFGRRDGEDRLQQRINSMASRGQGPRVEAFRPEQPAAAPPAVFVPSGRRTGIHVVDRVDFERARGLIQPLASEGDFVGLTKKLKADQGVVLLVHHGKTSGPEDRSSVFVYLAPQLK